MAPPTQHAAAAAPAETSFMPLASAMAEHHAALTPNEQASSVATAATPARLWLDFVNGEGTAASSSIPTGAARPGDRLADFASFVRWLRDARAIDATRAGGLVRRAAEQPNAAHAALADVRRVARTLRALAERGATDAHVRHAALAEINRVLGRSACHRRLEVRDDGGYVCSHVAVGDAFSALLIPIVDSAAASLMAGELDRVHRCADARCPRVFYDATRNGARRWCDMSRCGNRAKAARHRRKLTTPTLAGVARRDASPPS